MRVEIDTSLVRRLIGRQFPRWSDLPIRPVEVDGWDNRTFRLGEELSVRLPSAERYAGQVEKEQHWLPRLAPLLTLPIPTPIAMGFPMEGYPWHWSVYRWLDGESANSGQAVDLCLLASELGQFLRILQQIDPSDGPLPGEQNFFRGGPLSVYDAEARAAMVELTGRIDVDAVTDVWETALETQWTRAPVWLHGDVSAANLLVREGRLSAVIDFGSSGVGDPACDLTIAWTLFDGESRESFRRALPIDDAAWARGRGWALWKALITLAEHLSSDREKAGEAERVIGDVLEEHRGVD